MATEELYKVSILGLQRDKAAVLSYLQEQGIMHLNPVKHDILKRDSALDEIEDVVTVLLELGWMVEHLGKEVKEPSLTFPGRNVHEALHEAKEIKRKIHEKLSETVNGLAHTEDEIESLTSRKQLLASIPLDLPARFSAPRESALSFTYLLKEPSYRKKEIPTLRKLFGTLKLSVIRDGGWILVQGKTQDKEAALKHIREAGLAQTPLELRKSITEELQLAEQRLAELTMNREAFRRDLQNIATKHYAKARKLQYELTIFHDRCEAPLQFLRTQETFLAEGYIPTRQLDALRQLKKIAKVHVTTELAKTGPTKLRNMPYVRHFEFLTKMFGVPSYNRVDPTLYISLFLPLFFGFMFSDVGYGIMLALGALWLLRKADASVPVLKDAGYVLLVCSFTTVLFGFFFGSFFGNLIKITPWLFDPFANAQLVLISALAIGIAHLNLGILTGAFEAVRRADVRTLLLQHVALLLLQGGAVLIVFGYNLGWIVIGLAVGMFIVKSSLMGIMDVTGFLGTWFSYARLLALSLATGGIALGVNIMADQLGQLGLFGPVLFVLLLVFGHLFNFVLNVLGSSIHSVRLHYIEFFSQFYEGSGSPFKEFSTRRVKETL